MDEALDIEEYSQLSHSQREASLWKKIEQLASNQSIEDFGRRQKRASSLTRVSVLEPTVLAPYMFSPVYGQFIVFPDY